MTYLRAIALLALAACGGDDAPAEALDGRWRVTWSCLSGCGLPPPTATMAPAIVVDGDAVAYEEARPTVLHHGERVGDCLLVDGAWGDTVGRGREPYDLCVVEPGHVEALIWEIGAAGAEQTKWSMSGAR